jgi:hypothetical protein
MVRNLLIFLLLSCVASLAGPVGAQTDGGLVPRKILAIYDSRDEPELAYAGLHRSAQMVLEHLGCVVTYWDVAGPVPLPSHADMAQYRGVIVQLWRKEQPRAAELIEWLVAEVKAGRKLVMTGTLWPVKDTLTKSEIPEELLNRYKAAIGFDTNDYYTENPALLEYAHKNKMAVDYERRLPINPPLHPSMHAIRAPTETIISVRRKGMPQSESPVAAITKSGGVLLEPYFLYRKPNSDFKQWYIDPFYFFEKAFDLKDLPRPDVSTISGRRAWYNHLDGDALLSVSRIKKGEYCGAVLRDRLFKKYDLPFTVSVIVCEVDPGALGREEVVKLAKSIFALPNVEPASHTFSHPFDWAAALAAGKGEQVAPDKGKLPYGHFLNVPNYQFSLKKEINYAADYIDKHLAPPGKKCSVVLWSGNCLPPEEAIGLVEELGIAQMNGGDTIFDSLNPSLSGVAPLVLQVGNRFQVYTSMANENIYTNLWTGPFWGQRRVVQTFERTGKPRRLRPMNIYFHFYAGERLAALNALKHAIKWAQNTPHSPIYASQYYRMVQGFLKAAFKELPGGGYEVSGYGDMRTVRFDRTSRKVDLAKSKNVQGFNYHGGSLYVHLGAGQAIIYLGDENPQLPYLKEASGLLHGWEAGPGRVSFTYMGWGRGPVVLAGLKPGAKLKLSAAGWRSAGPVDAGGEVELSGPAGVRVDVSW